MRKIVFLDMDGVIVDFGHQIDIINKDPKISKEHKSSPDQIDGIFKDPPPIKDSIESIIKLYNLKASINKGLKRSIKNYL